jgi:peptidoglycan/xylan/chitin deacetylase (PgdA/CDA1 family)
MIRHIERELKRAVKAVVSPAIEAAGVNDRALSVPLADTSRWTVLTYHRIISSDDEDPYRSGMSVRADHFRSQLEYLARRFDIRTVHEAAACFYRGSTGARPLLSITFDDGYLDNLEVAAPILSRVGVPASFYIAVGGLDAPTPFWWDRVTHAVRTSARREPVDSAELGLPGPVRRWSTAPLARGDLAHELIAAIWTLPEAEVEPAVRRIREALDGESAPGPTLPQRMDCEGVRALHALGFEIGAHSVSHVNLCLREGDALRAELDDSRLVLEQTLGSPVRGFAYPGGRLDTTVVECARTLGFAYALTTDSGPNDRRSDPMRLRRIGAPDSPTADFKRALGRALVRDALTAPTLPLGLIRLFS